MQLTRNTGAKIKSTIILLSTNHNIHNKPCCGLLFNSTRFDFSDKWVFQVSCNPPYNTLLLNADILAIGNLWRQRMELSIASYLEQEQDVSSE